MAEETKGTNGNGKAAVQATTAPQVQASSLPPMLMDIADATAKDANPFTPLLDEGLFARMWRAAKVYASSKLVPAHFQGEVESTFVALQIAYRLQLDPWGVLQNIYVIHGKPGFQATFAIALVNTRGPFIGPIQWRFEGTGDNRSCTAYAIHKVTGEVCEATVDWKMVKAEGWLSKNGSKWATMERMMFCYRTASFLARLYCPEVLMGFRMADELEDAGEQGPQVQQPASGARLAPAVAAEAPAVEAAEPPAPPRRKRSEEVMEKLKATRAKADQQAPVLPPPAEAPAAEAPPAVAPEVGVPQAQVQIPAEAGGEAKAKLVLVDDRTASAPAQAQPDPVAVDALMEMAFSLGAAADEGELLNLCKGLLDQPVRSLRSLTRQQIAIMMDKLDRRYGKK
jgi:hypothetical protein